MTLASHAHFDLPERQSAFVGLLVHPMVSPVRHRDLHARVTRHRRHLEQWARRVGYRITSVGSAYRLRRTPLAGVVAIPDGGPPPRRELVLTLVVAAAVEDETSDSVTLQAISDAVRQLAAQAGLAEYDPSRRPHRLGLVRAVNRLVDLGVLDRRTDRDDLLRAWEDDGQGVSAGYLIDRDALVLLLDPHDLTLALTRPDDGEAADTRGPRLLRLLLETQSVTYADLDADDLQYLVGQRSRLAHQAAEMTGGVVELRADGMLLVLPSDEPHSAQATVGFPAVSARAWVALRLLDDAVAASVAESDRPGMRCCPAAVVDDLARRVHTQAGTRLTQELREGPATIRGAAEAELTEAGLLHVTDGAWLLRPAAARYRDADLTMPQDAPGRAPFESAAPGPASGDDGDRWGGEGAAGTDRAAPAARDTGRPADDLGAQDTLFGDLT